MRKQLTVALGLAVLATPAFATKARLQALGEDTAGSFYVNDNRNIFLNPAQVNNHKDLVTFEWGAANGSSAAATNNADVTAGQRGEGGVFRQAGSLVYGLQFNHSVAEANAFRSAAGLTINDAQEKNVLSAFVGGDAGVKWGAGLDYSGSKKNEDNGAYQEAMRLRLGGIMGDLQAFSTINVINQAEDGAGATFRGKLGYRLGATYNLSGTTLFADWRSLSADGDASTGLGVHDEALNAQRFEVGAGRVSRLNDRANLFTRVSFLHYQTRNNRADLVSTDSGTFQGIPGAATFQCSFASSIATCREYNTQRINAVVGLETEATSWLTLRGSVGQVLWGQEEDRRHERAVLASTSVNAGASLKFGELTVDGVIGNNDGTTAAATADTTAGAGSLRTDLLMTRVAMTYRF